MWGPDGEVIADGVLEPGSDCYFAFTDGPQPVERWALTRITHEEAERLAAEKGIKQEFGDALYRQRHAERA